MTSFRLTVGSLVLATAVLAPAEAGAQEIPLHNHFFWEQPRPGQVLDAEIRAHRDMRWSSASQHRGWTKRSSGLRATRFSARRLTACSRRWPVPS